MQRVTPLSGLDRDDVENVYVFVADALRWDALPDRVADRGLTARTAASALATPQSMPSLVTGLYPPRHGVSWFHHAMSPEIDTVFNEDGIDGSFVDSKLRRPLDSLLGEPPERTLREATPPFVNVELDHGGHAPYPAMSDATPQEIFAELSRDPNAVRRHYEEAVEASVDRFERRLAELEDRGLLAETLVVFTSDHGELLGEHGGFTGHSLPPAPELVYVPTTFVHPSLESGSETDAFVQHVDLVPTILDALDLGERPGLAGESLLRPIDADRPAYVHGTVHPARRWRETRLDPVFEAPSVWTRGGGHVFVKSPTPNRVVTALYEAFQSGYTAAYNREQSSLRTLATTLRRYVPGTWTYGDPSIGVEEAEAFCESIYDQEVDVGRAELSEETHDHLEDLGYV